MRVFIILFLFYPFVGFSQKNYSGIILDKSTKKEIAYASIGLLKENKGTTSDEKGNFKLASNYRDDSIIISAVGYKTLIFPVDKIVENIKFELEENAVLLNEVIISNKMPKTTPFVLNEFGNCWINYYTVGIGTHSQVAQHYYAPGANMQLTKLHVCKEGVQTIFRIRIYDMDSITGKPLHDLVGKTIEVNSSKRNIEVDLENYNIYLLKRDFFVAIEWLFIPSNEFIVNRKIKGNRVIYSNYYPGLTYKEKKINSGNPAPRFWKLNFNGRWQAPYDWESNYSFMISAELVPF